MCCSLIIQENVRFQYMTGFCHKPYSIFDQIKLRSSYLAVSRQQSDL